MSAAEPRAYTPDECRAMFLQNVWLFIDYWEGLSGKSSREKLEGFAFTLLAEIDGASVRIPGFGLTPHPHKDDQQYNAEQGENWWPNDCDIAGGLHEHFHKYDPRNP